MKAILFLLMAAPSVGFAETIPGWPCLVEASKVVSSQELKPGEVTLAPPYSKKVGFFDPQGPSVRYYIAIGDGSNPSTFGFVISMNTADCSPKSAPVATIPID